MRHVTFLRARSVQQTIRAEADPAAVLSAGGEAPLDVSVARFYDAVFAQASLRRDRLRTTVLQRRLAACLRAVGERHIDDATRRVAHDAKARERAIQAIAIGVTSFFRDPPVFASLECLLPTLAAQRADGLRVLSVGCSDGRELYSVALLLDRLSIPARTLHGIDCRARAIDAARAGRYTASQAHEVAVEYRSALGVGAVLNGHSDYQVSDALRRRCTWEVADAFSLVPTEPFDLVLCRNLLIYLTPASALELWQTLRAIVAPDGLVVVGKAERPHPRAGMLRIVNGVYRPREVRR